MRNYYWTAESWGSEDLPENYEEIIERANELIDGYIEAGGEDSADDYSARLWDRYCMDGKLDLDVKIPEH